MKNKTTLLKILFFISVVAMSASCSKDIDIPNTICNAGTGGTHTLILKPEHHGDPIPGLPGYPDSAFIKFNSNEFPGDNPALYDLVVVGEVGLSEVVISNMKCGKYFLFMTGKDESIAERVKGGIPFSVPQEPGVYTIKVPVTED